MAFGDIGDIFSGLSSPGRKRKDAPGWWDKVFPMGDILSEPEMGAEEAELAQLMLENARQQSAYGPFLMQMQMEAAGFRFDYDTEGKPTGYTKIPWEERIADLSPQEQRNLQFQEIQMNEGFIAMGYNPETGKRFESEEAWKGAMTPQQEQRYTLESEAMGRELKALRGELDVSPGLERDIREGRLLMEEDVARRGGIGGTAEIQREAEFEEGALIARESARHGMLREAEAVRASLRGGGGTAAGTAAAGAGYLARPSVAGAPTPTGYGGGGIMGTLSAAMQPYQSLRMEKEQQKAGIMGLAGTVAGMYFGGPAGAAAGGALGRKAGGGGRRGDFPTSQHGSF